MNGQRHQRQPSGLEARNEARSEHRMNGHRHLNPKRRHLKLEVPAIKREDMLYGVASCPPGWRTIGMTVEADVGVQIFDVRLGPSNLNYAPLVNLLASAFVRPGVGFGERPGNVDWDVERISEWGTQLSVGYVGGVVRSIDMWIVNAKNPDALLPTWRTCSQCGCSNYLDLDGRNACRICHAVGRMGFAPRSQSDAALRQKDSTE